MVESLLFGRIPYFLVKEDAHPALLPALRSRNQIMDHVAMNVGETIVTPRIAVGELLVIEAHEVEYGRVNVGDVVAVFDGVETEFVGCAVDVSLFDAAAGHENGEPVGMMIPSGAFLGAA